MIRRPAGDSWLLISQVLHAHLSAAVAERWGNDKVTPLERTEQLLPAIRDHDFGWGEWERSPTVDPKNGQPREFTEMPSAVACDIWRHSIHHCDGDSPWGGLWVSRHFSFLAEQGVKARKESTDESEQQERRALEDFLADQQRLQAQWQQDILNQEELSSGEFDHWADYGFRQVRLFDWISLKLCMREETIPWPVMTSAGEEIVFTPGAGNVISVSPWPLDVAEMRLEIPAQQIPARPYASDEELQQVLTSAPVVELGWKLVPGSTQ